MVVMNYMIKLYQLFVEKKELLQVLYSDICKIGYNRAARIIEKMESEGIVSPANHVGRREVLVGKDN